MRVIDRYLADFEYFFKIAGWAILVACVGPFIAVMLAMMFPFALVGRIVRAITRDTYN